MKRIYVLSFQVRSKCLLPLVPKTQIFHPKGLKCEANYADATESNSRKHIPFF
ncbi:hypothetical protein LEP1GSC103_3263 [Leptospira borgpetersenii serovar Javanica str. UI 09931]|uniref:Uncharacterized protein n=2 Tax=Leptospira borgpetersenii TaxID=174 RepID=A0A0S2IRY1_LEPBO|nr:hypothetical protein LBBP_02152 [Leptospira borgpetersenii serovar Ballum]EKR00331.1 hypothetical protein LEP1GSC121_3754 [Leptospira borgpetersenii serovar Castellonis str. 200801910]EMN58817.1 hypothetical protein LEP1GSC090_0984 [Leptospira borgpetersenii serovar Javanica str. MK146]EMO11605.1 hypothetical protein LEP1GSC137_3350 [Leptospira borgpetersenii str. Noumea 25]EPG57962.1 hypothetical protein LEP1GSC103_3263 [Leptospira borgpetersenii serovar Javanica str. UI 09931]